MYSRFVQEGYYQFPEPLEPNKAVELYNKIRASRPFGRELFINSESDYTLATIGQRVNPEASNINLLNTLIKELDFIEKNSTVTNALTTVLGNDYEILLKKVVCGVKQEWMPDWVWNQVKDAKYVRNLGAYIKPEYRDITYFFGIDYHQDNIDIKDSESDFITMYVYLDEVTRKSSPLWVIPGSHQYGVTIFPYELNIHGDTCTYGDGAGQKTKLCVNCFTGSPGTTAFWHSGILHGSYPTHEDSERISLRYLIKQKTNGKTLLSETNEQINGPLSLKERYQLRRQQRMGE